MEVGNNGTFAIRDGNMLIAGTLDNGKRDDVVRHYRGNKVSTEILSDDQLYLTNEVYR